METPSVIKDSTPYKLQLKSHTMEKYEFQHPQPKRPKSLRINEVCVGMSSTVCISFILLTITQFF
ncbi:hypothetical protein Patl1_32442 [Pistacia atlantica]|uniref:Uncharacterized protein n=1 Tax=Pistacia atlantica TaxID=434234 RepID=A0ACC1ANN1_9ROSI|nr:hypothetical protein Patl1_32442 [Pistacia atlantica]